MQELQSVLVGRGNTWAKTAECKWEQRMQLTKKNTDLQDLRHIAYNQVKGFESLKVLNNADI
jgi:hypothetical protein